MSLSIQKCVEQKKNTDWTLPMKQWQVVDEVMWMANTGVMPNGKEYSKQEFEKWINAVFEYITGEKK